MTLPALALASALAPGSLPAAAAPDPAYGEHLAAECVACHRPDGGAGAIPGIVGMPYDAIVRALLEYRDGTRDDPAMASVARGLGRQEIEALAAYFSGAPPP